MKKFIWPGVATILVLGFIAIGMTNSTDVRTSMGQGALWSTEVENLDGSGNLNLYGSATVGGALAITGATTFGGDVTITDDNIIFGNGTALSTASTAGASYGQIIYAYLGGTSDAVEGSALVATATVSGFTVCVQPAQQDRTGVVGVAVSATSTGSVVGVYISGYVNARTTGTVVAGDTLVYSDLADGYLEADTTPTTGADVAVAAGIGPTAGGLTKVILYK